MTYVLVGLLVLQGLSGLGGGLAMLAAPDGSVIGIDTAWLEEVPIIDDWLIPGLFLSGVLGVGPLLVAWAILRRPRLAWATRIEAATGRHVSWSASVAIGVTLLLFLLYEAQILNSEEARMLQWIFGSVGLAIAVLPFTPPIRRDLEVDPSATG